MQAKRGRAPPSKNMMIQQLPLEKALREGFLRQLMLLLRVYVICIYIYTYIYIYIRVYMYVHIATYYVYV